MPVISANTQARLEGYFRLEWKLAAQRTHTMADEKTFLLPVVVDATRDADAKVPAEFKSRRGPPRFTSRVGTRRFRKSRLGVAYVVEGLVQKVDNRVRIKATLIKTADNFQEWSDRFDKELKDIFALQDEIAGLIAQNLALTLGTSSPAAPKLAGHSSNLAASDAYLRGRAAGAAGSARAHYHEALQADPGYGLVWARLAQISLRSFTTALDRSEATMTRARAEADGRRGQASA